MLKEIKPLTGLRAFAASGVFLFHFAPGMNTLFPSLRALDWIVGQGDKGVDLFFILSGFVLAYNYADKMLKFSLREYRNFLVARLARIYPVHLFGLAVWGGFLVINLFIHHIQIEPGSFGFPTFIANLLLVHAWSIPMRMDWNYPAWSISLEWFAYLLFPFFAVSLLRIRSKAIAVTAICLISLSAPILSAAPYFHFVRILSEFTCGMLLYLLYHSGFANRFNWGIVTIVSSVASILLVHWLTWFIFPVFVVLLYSLAAGRGFVSRVLGSSLANYWGRVSYSLYMMHAAVISALHVLAPPLRFAASGFVVRAGVLLLYPFSVAAVAAVTYQFVEQPFRRKIRDLTRPTRHRSSAVASVIATQDE